MKKFILTIGALLVCNASSAQTETIKWYMDDTTYITSTCESGGDVSVPGQMPTKRGYEFIGWRIPQYVPLEYIQNVANETYIDTGVWADIDTKIVVDFMPMTAPAQNNGCPIFGYYAGGRNNIIIHGGLTAYADNYDTIYFSNYKTYWSRNPVRHKLALSKYGYSVDDGAIRTMSSAAQNTFFVPSLFVFANSASNISQCVDRIYSLQVYQNNILTHDYVPAKDPDGVVCLYDKVDGIFLYNAGTGEFIGGPVVDYD